jgi:outer membrane protein
MVRSTLIFAVLTSSAAHAQYLNHSLGAGPHLTWVASNRSVLWGLSLEYSKYLESSFEFFGRVPLVIAEQPEQPRVFGTGASLGVRYLFIEGSVQPWAGLQLTGLALFAEPVTWFMGAGTTLGLDWTLSESWAVGARFSYDVFVRLNDPWRHQLGGTFTVSVLY